MSAAGLRWHPHVNASQQDSGGLKLLRLQSGTDGFLGTEEGKKELRLRKQPFFFTEQLKVQTNKGNMEITTATRTVSSSKAGRLLPVRAGHGNIHSSVDVACLDSTLKCILTLLWAKLKKSEYR